MWNCAFGPFSVPRRLADVLPHHRRHPLGRRGPSLTSSARRSYNRGLAFPWQRQGRFAVKVIRWTTTATLSASVSRSCLSWGENGPRRRNRRRPIMVPVNRGSKNETGKKRGDWLGSDGCVCGKISSRQQTTARSDVCESSWTHTLDCLVMNDNHLSLVSFIPPTSFFMLTIFARVHNFCRPHCSGL